MQETKHPNTHDFECRPGFQQPDSQKKKDEFVYYGLVVWYSDILKAQCNLADVQMVVRDTLRLNVFYEAMESIIVGNLEYYDLKQPF